MRGKFIFKNPTIVCRGCGLTVLKTGAAQKYCRTCSYKDVAGNRQKWSEKNPEYKRSWWRKNRDRIRESQVQAGQKISEAYRSSLCTMNRIVEPLWAIRFCVPYSPWASKNARIMVGRYKKIYTSKDVKDYSNLVFVIASMAVKNSGVAVRHNKIWISIFVQKPHHRGDAINVIDTICDALKKAVGIDDRWFCIRQIDWEIVKISEPKIFIEVAQEDVGDVHPCEDCGRLMPLDDYPKNAAAYRGKSFHCADCRRKGGADKAIAELKIIEDLEIDDDGDVADGRNQLGAAS